VTLDALSLRDPGGIGDTACPGKPVLRLRNAKDGASGLACHQARWRENLRDVRRESGALKRWRQIAGASRGGLRGALKPGASACPASKGLWGGCTT
jgi:hypothetical protein